MADIKEEIYDLLYDCQEHGNMRFENLPDWIEYDKVAGDWVANLKVLEFGNIMYRKYQIIITWDRYDKQYYFIDAIGLKKLYNDYIRTAEEKGLIESLYDLFGGLINSKGYKQLDSHIGAIYGESITIERCQQITTQLKDKGFASSNVIFGVGSYTMQYNTRDSLGFAMKTTYAEIDGKPTPVFKDPKTDTNKLKKSLKGYIKVVKKGNEYTTVEFEEKDQVKENCFTTLMYEDSIFPETDFYHIQTTWENDFKCLLNK